MIKKANIADVMVSSVGVRNPAVSNDIKEFLASDMDTAEVDIGRYKNTAAAAGSYNVAARRIGGVKVMTRRGKLYLVKKDVWEAQRAR